jgi:hypothetical protein
VSASSEATIAGQLTQVLEKLEKGVEVPMDADKLETLISSAVTQYADAAPAHRAAIADAAAGAIFALLWALDEQERHEGVRQLAILLIVERARAEGLDGSRAR